MASHHYGPPHDIFTYDVSALQNMTCKNTRQSITKMVTSTSNFMEPYYITLFSNECDYATMTLLPAIN